MHPSLDKLLSIATRRVQMLGALTPVEAAPERLRLVDALRAGREARPCWTYAAVDHGDLCRALDAAENALESAAGEPLSDVVLARVRELALEASISAAAGTRDVSRLARERFPAPAPPLAALAAELCVAWLADGVRGEPSEAIPSDAADSRSLLSRLRAEVGRQRLPFSVTLQPTLAPLAATGDGVILVAPGRMVTEADVERTVLHEIEGHVRPRVRATFARHPLFRIGTARGVDHQEGRAVMLEERGGLLGPRRRRQLAARHRAVLSMWNGATFHDVASTLVRDHGLEVPDAVLVAERAFRGGDGSRPGLGRERVYLEAFVHVRAHLAARPEDEDVLAAGQIAVDAAVALAPFA